MLEAKKCQKCGESKPRADFYPHPKAADGLLSKCKTCHKRDVRENRALKADKYKEYEKSRAPAPHRVSARSEYQATPEGKEAIRRAKRKFDRERPEQRKANFAVSNAIRDKRLLRGPCEVCGSLKVQGHHDDYNKPLDVRWLCVKHHNEWHKNNTPIYPSA